MKRQRIWLPFETRHIERAAVQWKGLHCWADQRFALVPALQDVNKQ